jgi:rfaE bifunctional protein nucleotidyltransferase chain/domain
VRRLFAGRARARSEKVAMAVGVFDLLPRGHLELLQFASRRAARVVVAINSDASAHRLKEAGRPVIPAVQRAALLAAVRVVAMVLVFDEDPPERACELVRPDVLVKGSDWEGRPVAGAEDAGEVAFCPRAAGSPSTIGTILQAAVAARGPIA